MKRTPIYSRSARKPRGRGSIAGEDDTAQASLRASSRASNVPQAPPRPPRFSRLRVFASRHERAMLVFGSMLLTAFGFALYLALSPIPQRLTQKDIDQAVMHTLLNARLPSQEALAFEKIRPSVVRVVQESKSESHGAHRMQGVLRGVGTGVVIIDNGTILTSLHVVEGEGINLKVVFFDGTESKAVVLKKQPESDLAVIKAATIPDDLKPAVMRSTQRLAVGDKVVAVGFPFNIGPSASSGIVSGLKRVYRAPDGGEVLKDLIQFDAAANPGNSGGPLITMSGEVVGIVAAILSPHEQGTFIGIGFAVPIEAAVSAAGQSPF